MSYRGLIVEPLDNGNIRYRVRVKGNRAKRITLLAGPDHDDFEADYAAARKGVTPDRRAAEQDPTYRLRCGAVRQCIEASLHRAQKRSSSKGLHFDLTFEDVWRLLLDQGGRCALSGVEFSFSKPANHRRDPNAFSLDRLVPEQGYTKSNIRLLTTIANVARSDWGDDEFLEMCQSVMAFRGLSVHVSTKVTTMTNKIRYKSIA